MLPNWEHTAIGYQRYEMLKLPRNWHRVDEIGLLFALRRRAIPNNDAAFCRTFVRAALELCAATHPVSRRLVVRRRAENWWSIRGVHYRYVPLINADLLPELEMRIHATTALTLIAAPELDGALRRIVETMDRRRMPCIFSLDAFLAYRVFFARLDSGWSTHELLCWMLHAYNKCAHEDGLSDLIIAGLEKLSNPHVGRASNRPTTPANPNDPASWHT
jgi:hypothetical protein